MKTVAHCKTKEEMVCCIKYDQCRDDRSDHIKNDCNAYRNVSGLNQMGWLDQRWVGICKFPFNYRGKIYYKCTTKGDSKCYRWCATHVNENNVYIENSDLWGYCGSNVP